MNHRIEQIREAEKKSHIDTYTSTVLFEKGSWLSKPIKTVVDLFPYFDGSENFRGLDLGCGVGRNCIPLAQQLKKQECKIDCVDILDISITYLEKYSVEYEVADCINGIVKPLEAFKIRQNYYDLVLGISALEHVESEEAFWDILVKIEKGVKQKGIVCFVINTDVMETDKVTGERLMPQFEVNLSEQCLKEYLEKVYVDWEILKYVVNVQEYDIPRGNMVHLTTKAVTWVARKP